MDSVAIVRSDKRILTGKKKIAWGIEEMKREKEK